ncbi:MAG TPA: hypothetical protein ENN84_05030 [Candidatus Marinimicrobia bacterium]|nr:hypothetical protein [Candidatus Neomarinimicrobiota bacterium]
MMNYLEDHKLQVSHKINSPLMRGAGGASAVHSPVTSIIRPDKSLRTHSPSSVRRSLVHHNQQSTIKVGDYDQKISIYQLPFINPL